MPLRLINLFFKVALCCLFLIVFAQNNDLVAQTITIEKIGTEHGLSSEKVREIHEDKYGYKWISTGHGLNKFDGYSFEVFRYDPQDSFSIRANSQGKIYEDKKANIWVTLDVGGISMLDRAKGQFKYFCYDYENLSHSNNFVTNVFFDSKGRSWVSSNLTINKVDYDKGKYFPVDVQGFQNPSVSFIAETKNGRILMGGDEGLFTFDEQKNSFHEVTYEGKSLPKTRQFLSPDNGEGLVYSKEKGLYRFDEASLTIEKIPLPDNSAENVNNVFESEGRLIISFKGKGLLEYTSNGWKEREIEGFSSNEFWYADLIEGQKKALMIDTNYKVYLFNLETGLASFIMDHPQPIGTYSFDAEEGVLWIGSNYAGLNKITIRNQDFKNIQVYPEGKEDFKNRVNAISASGEGDVFFSSGQGLMKYEFSSGKLLPQIIYETGDEFWIHSIVFYKKNLLLGTTKGVLEFDAKSRSLKQLNATFEGQNITNLALDQNEALWITGNKGLFKYDFSNGEVWHISGLENMPGILKAVENRVLMVDSKNDVWIGTVMAGLFRIKEENDKVSFDQFNYTGIRKTKNQAQTVNTILEDSKGNFWIGGFSSGLLKFDREIEKWHNMTPKGAKPIPNIQGILEAEDGSLWMSAIDGLHKYNPETEKFRRFGFEEGLNSIDFQLQAAYKTGNTMFFGSNSALVNFDPSSIKASTAVLDVFIERVRLFDTELKRDKPIQEISELSFSYNQNFIGFDFLSINYSNSDKLNYSYKLEGVDENWVNNGKLRSANYANLPPGTYTFKVRAGLNASDWSPEEATMIIHIRAPFWQKWWFYLSIILLFVAILYLLHFLRLKSKLHKVKVMETVRKKAAADFHDEMGNKLTRIALFSEVLERKLNGAQPETSEYVEKIKSNSRSLNNSMRDFLWALDPKKDTAYDLATMLKDFGEELFDKTDVAFSVDQIPAALHEITLNMDWKRHLIMTFKEAMHNVLKHAEAQNVFLHFKLEKRVFSITLKDDGKGFDLESASKGYGLRNMKLRISEVDGKLKIDSETGVGTRITFMGEPQVDERI